MARPGRRPVTVSAVDQIVSVSCPSDSFCMAASAPAVDASGNALIYNGSSWSAPAHLSTESMNSVSCAPGTSFCIALSDGSYYTTNGTTWSNATSFDPGKPSVLSCASATYCMITDGSTVFVL